MHGCGDWLVSQILFLFTRDHPHVVLDLREGSSRQLVSWLDEGLSDIAFTTQPEPRLRLEWNALIPPQLRLAVPNGHWLAVPNGHRLAGETSVRLADLAGEQLIGYRSGTDLREAINSGLATAAVRPSVILETNDTLTQLSMIAAGFGVGFLPLEGSASPAGVMLLPTEPAIFWPLGMAHRNRRGVPALTAEFVAAARPLLVDGLQWTRRAGPRLGAAFTTVRSAAGCLRSSHGVLASAALSGVLLSSSSEANSRMPISGLMRGAPIRRTFPDCRFVATAEPAAYEDDLRRHRAALINRYHGDDSGPQQLIAAGRGGRRCGHRRRERGEGVTLGPGDARTRDRRARTLSLSPGRSSRRCPPRCSGGPTRAAFRFEQFASLIWPGGSSHPCRRARRPPRCRTRLGCRPGVDTLETSFR